MIADIVYFNGAMPSRDEYQAKIAEDLVFLRLHCPASPMRDHIEMVLNNTALAYQAPKRT